MTDYDDNIDEVTIRRFLDNAEFHASHPEAKNEWAEGIWIGRALQHADQNAVDRDWLVSEFEERGLDAAVIAVPKPGDPVEPRLN